MRELVIVASLWLWALRYDPVLANVLMYHFEEASWRQ